MNILVLLFSISLILQISSQKSKSGNKINSNITTKFSSGPKYPILWDLNGESCDEYINFDTEEPIETAPAFEELIPGGEPANLKDNGITYTESETTPDNLDTMSFEETTMTFSPSVTAPTELTVEEVSITEINNVVATTVFPEAATTTEGATITEAATTKATTTKTKLTTNFKTTRGKFTTGTIATTAAPILQDCDLSWKNYDPYTDPYAPTIDGLIAGNYIDGSPVYVGRGAGNFFMKYTLAARVYINETSSQSGVYVVSYPNEFCDTSGTAEYLVVDPNYDYKWVLSSQGQMEMNAVAWAISRYNMSVARINITKNDGTVMSQIGASITTLGTIYYNPVKDTISTMGIKTYETLICVPKNVKYEPQFCAFEWKHYDPINDPTAPERDGILIGNYYDNTPVYLGRGNDICEAITPARVNIVNQTQSPGVYTSCDGVELLDNTASAEYVVKNPSYNYWWVNASSSDKILNAVKWSYFAETLAVSRIRIYNRRTKSRFTTIGKTFVGVGTWFYNPVTNYTESVGMQNVEMLMCSPNNSTNIIKAPADGCVHTWKRFNYRAKNLSSLDDGIPAGYYIDGSEIYVGAGFQVNTSDIVPARLVVGNASKPGVYVCGNDNEYFDRKRSAQYLVRNDSQIYRWVKRKYIVPYQVEIDGLYYTYSIARVNITDANNQTFSQIGTNFVFGPTFYFNPLTKAIRNITQYFEMVEILSCTVKT